MEGMEREPAGPEGLLFFLTVPEAKGPAVPPPDLPGSLDFFRASMISTRLLLVRQTQHVNTTMQWQANQSLGITSLRDGERHSYSGSHSEEENEQEERGPT
jgi:hypothetical protein